MMKEVKSNGSTPPDYWKKCALWWINTMTESTVFPKLPSHLESYYRKRYSRKRNSEATIAQSGDPNFERKVSNLTSIASMAIGDVQDSSEDEDTDEGHWEGFRLNACNGLPCPQGDVSSPAITPSEPPRIGSQPAPSPAAITQPAPSPAAMTQPDPSPAAMTQPDPSLPAPAAADPEQLFGSQPSSHVGTPLLLQFKAPWPQISNGPIPGPMRAVPGQESRRFMNLQSQIYPMRPSAPQFQYNQFIMPAGICSQYPNPYLTDIHMTGTPEQRPLIPVVESVNGRTCHNCQLGVHQCRGATNGHLKCTTKPHDYITCTHKVCKRRRREGM